MARLRKAEQSSQLGERIGLVVLGQDYPAKDLCQAALAEVVRANAETRAACSELRGSFPSLRIPTITFEAERLALDGDGCWNYLKQTRPNRYSRIRLVIDLREPRELGEIFPIAKSISIPDSVSHFVHLSLSVAGAEAAVAVPGSPRILALRISEQKLRTPGWLAHVAFSMAMDIALYHAFGLFQAFYGSADNYKREKWDFVRGRNPQRFTLWGLPVQGDAPRYVPLCPPQLGGVSWLDLSSDDRGKHVAEMVGVWRRFKLEKVPMVDDKADHLRRLAEAAFREYGAFNWKRVARECEKVRKASKGNVGGLVLCYTLFRPDEREARESVSSRFGRPSKRGDGKNWHKYMWKVVPLDRVEAEFGESIQSVLLFRLE